MQKIVKYAAVVIQNNKFLIVKGDGDDHWKNVGGKLEKNETPEECLRREVKEELGVEIAKEPKYYFSLPATKSVSDPNVELDIHLYLCEIVGTPRASSEISKLHWLSRQEFIDKKYNITYQISDFIIPKIINDGLIA